MVLALSLQTDIKSIGAYAGFAAIVGLALLVILYFAQAREMRRLSDQLEEQEDRLRRVPALAPMTVARPVAAQAPLAVARPGAPLPQPPLVGVPAAQATATVAIPGARRVAVTAAATGAPAVDAAAATLANAGDGVAAGSDEQQASIPGEAREAAVVEPAAKPSVPPAPGSPTVITAAAAGAPPESAGEPAPGPAAPEGPLAPATPPAVVAPATAAGAMASAAQAGGEAVAAVPGARRVSLAELAGEELAGEAQDPTVVAKTPSAVPLRARAAASAEPVGAVQETGGAESQEREGPSTSEIGVVAVAAPAEPQGPSAVVAPAREEPARGEEASAQRRGRGARSPLREGPPVLAPATAAGSRPRYPPPPRLEAGLVDPVAPTARVGAAAATAAAGGGGTLRRERRAGAGDGDGDGDGGEGSGGRASSGSTLRLAVIAVVLVGVIVLVASQLLSGGSSTPPGSTTTTTHSSSNPPPSSVTVAVLNGTTEGGLAGRVSATLTSEGYRRGAVANAPTQDHTSTVIEYTGANRNAAIEVALALALTPAQVVPASPGILAVASQSGATPTAVVVLGSNYAQR